MDARREAFRVQAPITHGDLGHPAQRWSAAGAAAFGSPARDGFGFLRPAELPAVCVRGDGPSRTGCRRAEGQSGAPTRSPGVRPAELPPIDGGSFAAVAVVRPGRGAAAAESLAAPVTGRLVPLETIGSAEVARVGLEASHGPRRVPLPGPAHRPGGVIVMMHSPAPCSSRLRQSAISRP